VSIAPSHMWHIYATYDELLAFYKPVQIKAIANSERQHWCCLLLLKSCC